MEMIGGRGFEREFALSDYNDFNIVINETAARQLGYADPEDVMGKDIYHLGGKGGKNKVVGVVKGFNQRSLHHVIKPMGFYIRILNHNRFFSIRFDGDQAEEIIDVVQAHWEAMFPNRPFDYFFLDQYFDLQYRQDHVFRNIMVLFTSLIIFLSGIGLLGLISITISQKMKELGIRKVLGAGLMDLLSLLGKEYMLIILIALVISGPICYLAGKEWLNQYAYRTDINLYYVLIPFFLMVLVTGFVMLFRANMLMGINPVETLKDE